MVIELKKRTYGYQYGILSIGDILDVDEDIAQRWIAKGIAKEVDNGRETEQGDAKGRTPETQQKKKTELIEMAQSRGIKILVKDTKADIIKKLEASQ